MNQLPMSLRTSSGEQFYQDAKMKGDLVPLAEEETLLAWSYWRIIENRFPYGIALKRHHLLLPIRVFPDASDITDDERAELSQILALVAPEYDFVTMNFPKRRSILAHFHLHLGEYHDSREQMTL
jgi:diadenosine tetraphosphate (Ap4A) HIT family hydrolase